MAINAQGGSVVPTPGQPNPTVYTPKELQPILRLSKTGVAALLHSGQLRAIRVGRKWLIPASALTAFLEGR
ncbi:helix-turn-helix domain-containing protein [Deinococcus sp.]|uniref:helix-turn-helix domain-containing protein n=1 Tax=Deinococcus sp. TaxID=47478 RepID=UPI003CC65737